MKVGIFGGSFNPPHLAHLIVAERVREQFGLDQVLWIPNRIPPHKPEAGLVAPAHRLAMTRLAVEGNPAFTVSDVELRRDGVSYTLDTVRSLQEAMPENEYHLIIGEDSLRDFPTWHRPEEIVRRVPLIVYRRPGVVIDSLPDYISARVRFAEAPLIEISGTDIRARLRAGRSIRYLVTEPTRTYIEKHGLYLDGLAAAS